MGTIGLDGFDATSSGLAMKQTQLRFIENARKGHEFDTEKKLELDLFKETGKGLIRFRGGP